MIAIRFNTAHTQARNCRLCLHIGSIAVYFGRKGDGRRLEILTPCQRFRWAGGGPRPRIIEL